MTDVVIFDIAEELDAASAGRPVRARSRVSESAVKTFEISAETVAKNMQEFVRSVNTMLAGADFQEGKYRLETVEVQAQISAEGKIGFLGAGAAAKGSASMKVVFERKEGDIPQ